MLSAAPLPPVEALREAHGLDDFASGVEPLDRWLRQSARTAAAAGTAPTYVLWRRERIVRH